MMHDTEPNQELQPPGEVAGEVKAFNTLFDYEALDFDLHLANETFDDNVRIDISAFEEKGGGGPANDLPVTEYTIETNAMGIQEPDVISYNSAISACEKGQQWEQALRLLLEMRSSRLEPNVMSYNSAISACSKGQQWEQALNLLPETRSSQLEPDVIS